MEFREHFPVCAWARSLPISGHLRNVAIELALLFDEKPSVDYLDVSDRELAYRSKVRIRTFANLKPLLGAMFPLRGSLGESVTRYTRPNISPAPSAKNAGAYAKFAEGLADFAIPSLSMSTPTVNIERETLHA